MGEFIRCFVCVLTQRISTICYNERNTEIFTIL